MTILPLVKELSGFAGVAISVTTFSVFSGVFYVFNKFLWKQKWVAWAVGIPNLNGRWECAGSSVDGSQGRDWNGTVNVEQTWSQIAVSLSTETSMSRSGLASLEKDPGHGYRLIYGYENTPTDPDDELRCHKGSCEVCILPDLKSATCVYFNDHQRKTVGTMKWKRISE